MPVGTVGCAPRGLRHRRRATTRVRHRQSSVGAEPVRIRRVLLMISFGSRSRRIYLDRGSVSGPHGLRPGGVPRGLRRAAFASDPQIKRTNMPLVERAASGPRAGAVSEGQPAHQEHVPFERDPGGWRVRGVSAAGEAQGECGASCVVRPRPPGRRLLDPTTLLIRVPLSRRDTLLVTYPTSFGVPPRFEAHHKVEAYLDRAEPTAIRTAIELAWEMQRR